MAGAAILFLVRAFQGKCSFTVVELVVAPAGTFVALRAVVVGVPFFGNLAAMYVFMAIHATCAECFEFPFLLRFMAGKTGRRHVRAFQREFGFCMLLQAVRAFCKSLYRMACRTIGSNNKARKLPFMVVLVAGSAGVVRQRIGHVFRDMALFAIHHFVFTFQRITRPVVVESIQIPNFPERILFVTIHTFIPKPVVVHVLVTCHAIVGRHAQSVLKYGQRSSRHRVAFPAINLFVFAFQRKFGGIVVEPAHAAPPGEGLFGVAIFTVGAEVVVMRIFVAIVAVFKRNIRKPLKFLAASGFLFMAIDALNIFVFANEREIRLVVVKLACRSKFIDGMAFGAVVTQCFLVYVLVAVDAFATQS